VTEPNVTRVPGPSTSASLLERAKARDASAWDRIVDLYTPLVYGWCRRGGLQEADALDVGQEVFGAVYTYLDRFRRDRPGDSFRGWLRTITRNKILDAARRREKFGGQAGSSDVAKLPDQLPEGECEPSEDDSERRAVLRRAVELVRGEVEPRTWAAFWQVAIEEQPVQQVAGALGISPNAVYLAKSRTLRRLRDLYGEIVDGLND
jgi:RNA polymerase sigma-70 factor (ECF subfamily)